MNVYIIDVNCRQILIHADKDEHISDMLRKLADELSETPNYEVDSITWDYPDTIGQCELVAIVNWRMKNA